MKKEEFVTRKYLDKRMDEQTKVVVTAVDGVLDKRLKKFDVRFDTVDFRFNGIEKRMDKLEDNLRKDINNVQILIDGYVKAQENFKQEFVIMKEEMRQVKKVLKQKLGVEISAM